MIDVSIIILFLTLVESFCFCFVDLIQNLIYFSERDYPFFRDTRRRFYIIVWFIIIWNLFLYAWIGFTTWLMISWYQMLYKFFEFLSNFAIRATWCKMWQGNWTSRCVSISATDCIHFVIGSWQVIENRRKLRQAISGPLISYRES